MYLKTLSLGDIHPYERNPRINDKAVEPVMKSIQKDGYRARIIVDKDGVIIAGHTRYEAMKRLGWTEAEVWIADDMTPEQIADYRIRDNLTADFAEWDFSELEAEIEEMDLDFDMSEFEGFEGTEDSWFDRSERDGAERQEGNDEYNDFLDKFEAKKTTDDCYTPDNIYDVVAKWVTNEYKVQRNKFVRPFFPGGDYQRENYPNECIVVDNPPFSIITEIVRFYCENGVRFFLFAPNLTLWSGNSKDSTYIATGVQITYENGADITTSFITNLDKWQVRTAPDLYNAIKAVNDENIGQISAEMPKYVYPDEVITASMVARWSKYGIDFYLGRDECFFVRELDQQKEQGKTVFGSGYLLSEKAAERRADAERRANEKSKAIQWQLSERELEIVRSLGK